MNTQIAQFLEPEALEAWAGRIESPHVSVTEIQRLVKADPALSLALDVARERGRVNEFLTGLRSSVDHLLANRLAIY